MKYSISLSHWEINAKYVLTLLIRIIVAGGTSAFLERTCSLSRHIKTWLRAGMNDSAFDDLDLLSWYGDEIDDIIDFIKNW